MVELFKMATDFFFEFQLVYLTDLWAFKEVGALCEFQFCWSSWNQLITVG
jgi:hypothetical protein